MGNPIALEMKIDVKGFTDKSSKLINSKTNCFARDRETIMIVAQKGDIKRFRITTQTRMQSKSNRLLSESKQVASKGNQEKKKGELGIRGEKCTFLPNLLIIERSKSFPKEKSKPDVRAEEEPICAPVRRGDGDDSKD